MNYQALKSYKLWIAVVGALLGVALSQGLIIEGSTAAAIVGWVLQVLGIGTAGATVTKPAELPVTTEGGN